MIEFEYRYFVDSIKNMIEFEYSIVVRPNCVVAKV